MQELDSIGDTAMAARFEEGILAKGRVQGEWTTDWWNPDDAAWTGAARHEAYFSTAEWHAWRAWVASAASEKAPRPVPVAIGAIPPQNVIALTGPADDQQNNDWYGY